MTAIYTGLFLVAGALLLGVSYTLIDRHLHRTLSSPVAADILAEVRGQYALSLLAVTALALLLGWVVAGRALAPLRAVVSAARAVSGHSLDRRIDPQGPDDELRELAETFDAMMERLERSFTSQRRFVANASHELRTPLTVMRTELDVALADPDTGEAELRRLALVLHEEVLRCQALIESLLALARSESGAVQRSERVDLSELAREAVGRLRAGAAERGVDLRLKAERVLVEGERRLLERLVWNVIENAVLYNRHGGFAHVEVSAGTGQAELRAENSGASVPAEALGSLMEPFPRLGQEAGAGAGLGLSLVRAVAAAHGGSVELSARSGGGLVVQVALPPAEPRSGADPQVGAHRPLGSRARASRAAPEPHPGSAPR
ncbi:MAG TPA: HAMP domain-containing sensor histidine kinase [Thermoleophilaceae bacterium]|nr:HAMP domain-containing sensor histidine kinase [Thermoleophilaceae bacterium]